MRSVNRKTSPKVIGGLVQKKNNWSAIADYYNTKQTLLVIDRQRPGKGYRHLLKQRDIYDFISILPDWNELSVGLNAIVLAPGRWDAWGYHCRGVVHICAWDENIWTEMSKEGYEAERHILEKLNVPCESSEYGMLCKFTEDTAKAHQLLATLLHELGHHHDRMSTKSKLRTSRGETYAEEYAKAYAERIWIDYQSVFGVF
ncbi:MAG TPA: hypothetical protein PKY82_08975 [Pyrinomonadaceae bacterium]|nr:hypothetical protein [Pyrinomonadaceae bacterium]